MAKKTVKSFSVSTGNKAVTVEIQTENKKPHKYEIYPDVVHPDLNNIAQHLQTGLQEAQTNSKKIVISDYRERSYVTIVTPLELHSNRYTAKKLKP